MLTYTLTVYTGERLLAGTKSTVYIKLIGEEGESDNKKLNPILGLGSGSEKQLKIKTKKSLGELLFVNLQSMKFLHVDDDWFCDKILVETPEDARITFPCYRWIEAEKELQLRSAKATLVFQDINPQLKAQRTKQVELRHKLFEWGFYGKGVPDTISASTAFSLPPVIRFSFQKQTEFVYTAAQALISLNLQVLADNKEKWKSIDELHEVNVGKKTKTYAYVEEQWAEDEFFGYQLLNGINPMMIKLCSTLPENFPVTEDMVKGLLGDSTLEQEMQKGNIFLCDYKILEGLVGNVVNNKQQYLTAPLCLLYSNPEGKMLPLAIQLGQKPGADNPIFLPTDTKNDWLLAKIYVRGAEFSVHEVDFHLLRTHLLCEVYTVATLRHLPSPHPLFKLLYPHTRYTLQISIMARNLLISEIGAVTLYSGIGGESLPELLSRATASLTYSALCLPENISERGLENVPNYYYRDDGINLWNIINKYVGGVLQYYYKSDEDVQKDTELQRWIMEIFKHGFLLNKSTGIPESFQTVVDLVKFVTMVIFTASAQHAAVNNGQFDFGAWMPNYPNALGKPPPKEKGQTTEATILQTLPDKSTTANSIASVKLLSTQSTDFRALGDFPDELFDEKVPCNAIKEFQEDLKALGATIEQRNDTIPLSYVYLLPKNIENSVAV
ncbi:hypothetical protein ACEWY4_006151 [Coilia grayii]|uniref:Hydroperoxide isomerase ALOXE3-like n=1 Tax=Coilia grayii TaxID=363190 RepID=A0ABD1KCN0_9TELE